MWKFNAIEIEIVRKLMRAIRENERIADFDEYLRKRRRKREKREREKKKERSRKRTYRRKTKLARNCGDETIRIFAPHVRTVCVHLGLLFHRARATREQRNANRKPGASFEKAEQRVE